MEAVQLLWLCADYRVFVPLCILAYGGVGCGYLELGLHGCMVACGGAGRFCFVSAVVVEHWECEGCGSIGWVSFVLQAR
jgi:hypothetical protein